jgi:DNA-binding beta-propeller fold protein YncE
MNPQITTEQRTRRIGWTLTCAAAMSVSLIAPAQAEYHVTSRIRIGGDGGWDYLEPDAVSRRLFVTHEDHVVVINMDTLKIVGDVPNSPGMGGVALSRELNRGYTANGDEDTIGVFELDTLKPLGKWQATGKEPNQIAYEPTTQRVFSFNSTGRNVTVFDARNGTVLATIDVDGRTEFFAVDGKGMIYDSLLDKSTVIAIDAKTMQVVATYSLAPYTQPSGLAMDTRTRRLFVPTRSQALLVLNADTGKIIDHFPLGANNDAVKFDPDLNLAFASNGDGTLTIVHEDSKDKFSLVQTVQTESGARTMAVDTKTHRLFLPTADFIAAPAATPENPQPRRTMVPDSFRVLVLEP